MPADAKKPDGFSLERWSRRKREAARETAPAAAPAPVPPVAAPVVAPVAAPRVPPPAPLPPVDSLTPDSDFTAFLQPKVDEAVKRLALKKLFADPHFNVMDGLDVYIDDYTKTIEIPPDVLERLMSNFAFDPPATRGEKPPTPPVDSTDAAPAAPEEPLPLAEKTADAADAPGAQDPKPSE
jgi:hypothetical protein